MNMDIYLKQLKKQYKYDELGAINQAIAWADAPISSVSDKYKCDAAFEFFSWQIRLPVCGYCHWAILPHEPHPDCEEAMGIGVHDDQGPGYDCGFCQDEGCGMCDPDPDTSYLFGDGDEDSDEPASTSTVYARALAHFGNAEEAREAASLYPGDFI